MPETPRDRLIRSFMDRQHAAAGGFDGPPLRDPSIRRRALEMFARANQTEAATKLNAAAHELRRPVVVDPAPSAQLERQRAAQNERLAVALEGVRDAMTAPPRMTVTNWIAVAAVIVAFAGVVVAVLLGH